MYQHLTSSTYILIHFIYNFFSWMLLILPLSNIPCFPQTVQSSCTRSSSDILLHLRHASASFTPPEQSVHTLVINPHLQPLFNIMPNLLSLLAIKQQVLVTFNLIHTHAASIKSLLPNLYSLSLTCNLFHVANHQMKLCLGADHLFQTIESDLIVVLCLVTAL